MREPRPDWSPLGVNFKILDEHPHLFYIRVPPPPPRCLRKDLYTLYVEVLQSITDAVRDMLSHNTQNKWKRSSNNFLFNFSFKFLFQNSVR